MEKLSISMPSNWLGGRSPAIAIFMPPYRFTRSHAAFNSAGLRSSSAM